MDIITQLFGIIGAACLILSFQMKKNTHFFLLQTIGCAFFIVNYGLLGSVTGCFINIASAARAFSIPICKPKYNPLLYALLILAPTLFIIFTFKEWQSFIMLTAFIIQTTLMFTKNGKLIRYAQFAVVSPLLLWYNIHVFTVGGIICEAFNIISALIAIIRFRKDGFEG